MKFSGQMMITLFDNQVKNYFKGNIPSNLDDVFIHILSDEQTTAIVNSRGVCIGFSAS